MSDKELDRLTIIEQVSHKHLTQSKASATLKITTRQVRRLLAKYRKQGAKGLISKHRNKPSSNKISNAIKTNALAIVRKNYLDFSPTFAHEKLVEIHQQKFSVETLRNWMINDGIWQSKRAKSISIHQSRVRREQRGELIQIDGFPHDWFEGRASKCNLTVFIDDATSELMVLHFTPTETTQAYMESLDCYLEQHGRPVSFYSDKHSIFRANMPDNEEKITQFNRALKTLDIELICANTPQAKGRVERSNKTLQDRLVKELRLREIDNIIDANKYLPEFIKDYNQRFTKSPLSEIDAHRPVLHDKKEIGLTLSSHNKSYRRSLKLSKSLTCQYNNIEYQIQTKQKGYRLRYSTVTICETFSGDVGILLEGKELEFKTYQKGECAVLISNEKTVGRAVDKAVLK